MEDKKIRQRRRSRKALPVHIGYGIFLFHLLLQTVRFAFSMYRLDYSLMPLHLHMSFSGVSLHLCCTSGVPNILNIITGI